MEDYSDYPLCPSGASCHPITKSSLSSESVILGVAVTVVTAILLYILAVATCIRQLRLGPNITLPETSEEESEDKP
jgi:hypothetical protein